MIYLSRTLTVKIGRKFIDGEDLTTHGRYDKQTIK